MDIELAEPAALAGLDIRRFRPGLVVVEAHPQVRQKILDYFAVKPLQSDWKISQGRHCEFMVHAGGQPASSPFRPSTSRSSGISDDTRIELHGCRRVRRERIRRVDAAHRSSDIPCETMEPRFTIAKGQLARAASARDSEIRSRSNADLTIQPGGPASSVRRSGSWHGDDDAVVSR